MLVVKDVQRALWATLAIAISLAKASEPLASTSRPLTCIPSNQIVCQYSAEEKEYCKNTQKGHTGHIHEMIVDFSSLTINMTYWWPDALGSTKGQYRQRSSQYTNGCPDRHDIICLSMPHFFEIQVEKSTSVFSGVWVTHFTEQISTTVIFGKCLVGD